MGLFKKKTQSGVDISAKLANIKLLKDTKRQKEAIAYEFILLMMLCGSKYRFRKQPYESIRDYAMKLVQDYNVTPGNLYPFIQKVEEAIYGGKTLDDEMFKQSIDAFNKIFEEIVGKPLPVEKLTS